MRYYFYSLSHSSPYKSQKLISLGSIYAGLSLVHSLLLPTRRTRRKRSRREEESDSGMLISQLNVVLYWRRCAEETPPGAITFYVMAREFPTTARRRDAGDRDVGTVKDHDPSLGIHGIALVIAHQPY